MLTDYVYWIFWIFIGPLIGVRARPQSRKSIFRIVALGAGLVMTGLLIGLASGHSVARLEFRLIVFGYTLVFAGLLLGLRVRAAGNPGAASDPPRK